MEDASGATFDFQEKRPGVYLSSDSIAGIVGNSYRLVFITEGGQGSRYESEFEELIGSCCEMK